MDITSILEVLSNLYLYGWAGAVLFFVLFVVLLTQSNKKGAVLSKLETEKRELEQQLTDCKEEVSELQSKLENLVEDNEQKAETIGQLESKLSTCEKEMAEKETKIKELEFQLKNLKEENLSQAETIKDLESKLSNAQNEIQAKENTIKAKESQIESLNKRISELESELEAVKLNYQLADLYIHMKKLQDEFGMDFTQNILKGISTMNIKDIDIGTAQKIFEHAMSSYTNFADDSDSASAASSSQGEEDVTESTEDA